MYTCCFRTDVVFFLAYFLHDLIRVPADTGGQQLITNRVLQLPPVPSLFWLPSFYTPGETSLLAWCFSSSSLLGLLHLQSPQSLAGDTEPCGRQAGQSSVMSRTEHFPKQTDVQPRRLRATNTLVLRNACECLNSL